MPTPPVPQPTLPTIGSGLPAADAGKTFMDVSVANSNTQLQDLKDSLSSQSQFPTKLVNGLTITDLINQANTAQANSQYLLDNDPNKNGGGTNKGFDIHQAIGGLFDNIHSTQSFGSKNTPTSLGEGKDFDRYASSGNFQTFGYTPGMGEGQEYKYGNAMTWGDTIGRALAGGGHLAYDTFMEGWKGWGRMTEALFTWDASKLMGSEQERYDMAQHQEDIMNKYAIYDTETSKDSIWNRQFFGTMLQQSGFAVGAGLQFALESYLTAGVGTIAEGLGLGSMMVARGAKTTATAGELINDTRKVMNTVTNTERVTNGISGIAKKLVPLYGTVDDMIKMGKAGAGGLQMAMTFGGGIKRGLSEFNMSRSESIFEAAGTYKQLKDRLVEDFVATNGREPSNEELEKIKQSAENASHDNFWTNIGVLSVMNRIQFDNMFNSFNKGRKIFSDSATHLGEEAFTVAGKIEGKAATRAYEKSWFFGRLGAVKSIATDFGGKKAAWEATKMLGKGLTKIEGSEGMQELIQNASDKGLEDYYYDLYHGKKGYTGRMGSVLDSMQNPLTDTEGMKTFLMGALTGALISPMSKIVTKVNESATDAYRKKQDPNYKSKKEQVEENLHMVNQLYKDPTQFRKEWIANTKIQNKAAATMEEAAKNHNEYVFYNAKDSAFAKTIASAIKLDMFDSIRDTLKEYGDNLSDEDFKKAFDLDPNSQNRKDVKSFMTNVGQQMDEYYTTFNNLKDQYGDRVLPELYKNNDPQKYAEAKLAKYALDDAIEMLATNVHKSKQAVKRASALQSEIASTKNIGGSSVEVLSKMGSEQAVTDTINLLEKEIKDTEKFVTDGGTLTKEQKELLKDKKEELQHTKVWQEAHADIVDNSDESYSPAAEKRAYQAYADLVNLYNKRSKLNAVVSKQDVDNTFVKIIDYMRLNKDNKAYVDAMNLLADPNNMKLITSSIISAHRANNEIFKQEHKAEVKKAGDTEEEVHADDIEELSKQLEANKNTTATDLEKHLQEEYAKSKKATEAAGGTMPDYELWKKTAGVSIAKRFEDAKKGKPKPPGPEAGGGTSTETKEDKSKIVVNGKVATMLEMNKVDGKVYVDYLLDVADETGQTEEQYDARRGTLIIDAKTLKATDSDGNPVEYSIGKPKEETKPTNTQTTSLSTTDPLYNIESFETAMGSVYTVLPDGRTQRFKTAIGKQSEPNDLIVFVKFTDDAQEQRFLRGVHDDNSGTKVYVIDNQGTKYSKNSDIRGKDVKFALVNPETGVVLETVETKQEPTVGYNTYDERRFTENGDQYRSKHIGNKVTKINYKEEPTESEEIEIEPEYEANDYDKVYTIARAIAQGKNVNVPENMPFIKNYPKLLEEFKKLEEQRIEALKTEPSKASSINARYDGLVKSLIDDYGYRIPEDNNDDVPAYAQGLDRIKKAQMESDVLYAGRDFQVGYRQVEPSNSLANKTDNFDEPTTGTGAYTRTDVNSNYVFDVATREFPPGTQIIYKVIEEQDQYNKMGPNRLTGEIYDRAKIFDKDGKVKQAAYDDTPIGIYAIIRGEERLIGSVHEPLWIQIKKGGNYPHIAAPEGVDIEEHVKLEVAKNRELRKTILDAFNKNSKFVISGVVSAKSNGILRMVNDAGLLKDRVNSKIGEGGSDNRHGYFAIVRNETLQTEVNVEATDVVETEAFTKNANQYSGVPALMLPTPTGQFMPTFIGLPKIDRNQAEFIMEAWRAFTGKKENQELVDAVYKAVDRVMSDKPDINILNEYLNQYYVNLERKKPLSKIGNGSEVAPGQAIFDIDAFGNIKLEVKDFKTKEWVKTTIRTEKDVPANILELLQNLRTTVKFNDRRNDSLRGINSTEKITFLSMENGKLISKDMTYNENLLEKATTFVDKGTQSETANKDWVYFANPVVKMQMTALKTSDPDATDIEEAPPTSEDLGDQPEEDLGAALLAALNTTNATEEQVQEKKEECTTDKGTDLQSEINNLI
jgi:hypothetical protein